MLFLVFGPARKFLDRTVRHAVQPPQERRKDMGPAEDDTDDIVISFEEEPEPEDDILPSETDPEAVEEDKADDIIDSDQDQAIYELAEALEISPSIAKLLYNEGYVDIGSLQGMNEDELRNIKGVGKVTARKILSYFSTVRRC